MRGGLPVLACYLFWLFILSIRKGKANGLHYREGW